MKLFLGAKGIDVLDFYLYALCSMRSDSLP